MTFKVKIECEGAFHDCAKGINFSLFLSLHVHSLSGSYHAQEISAFYLQRFVRNSS